MNQCFIHTSTTAHKEIPIASALVITQEFVGITFCTLKNFVNSNSQPLWGDSITEFENSQFMKSVWAHPKNIIRHFVLCKHKSTSLMHKSKILKFCKVLTDDFLELKSNLLGYFY